MAWYTASAIMLFEFKGGQQDVFSIWENVYLIEAPSIDAALKKAEMCAMRDEGDDDGTLTLDGRPAFLRFRGIRRVIPIANFDSDGDVPGDGAEVSYAKYCVTNESDFK